MGAFEKINVSICDFQSPITQEDISQLIDDKKVEIIRPCGGYIPSKQDLCLLNNFFKLRPEVGLRITTPDMLKLLPNLQVVSESVEGMFGRELEELRHLKQITSLRLMEKDISPIIPYRDTLKTLTLEGRLKRNAEAVLPQLYQLHSLSLLSTNLTSLACVANLPLYHLFQYGNNPKDPAPLAKLSDLKTLQVKTNTSWNDFSFIATLEKLQFIKVTYCPRLVTIPSLNKLHDLRFVEFTNCNNLEDITALWHLPASCEVLATGTTLAKKKINYGYTPEVGLQDWCREYSTNLPANLLVKH